MKLPAQFLLLLALFLTFSQVIVSSENEESGEAATSGEAGNFNACDLRNRPQICTADYTPVCGYIIGCIGGNCTNTFGNDCDACSNSTVSGYVNGACEDIQTTCDSHNRPKACSLIYTATCAIASNCTGTNCFANVSNSCEACSMNGVGYSLPGTCPGPDLGNILQNCPLNRPSICTADYTPVCAHLSNCVGRNCWSTAGNSCSACSDHDIDSYVPGECPEVVFNNEEGFINEEGFLNEEGFINEEGGLGFTQCAATTWPVVCPVDSNPVCAHFSGCQGGLADCTKTETNGCKACSQWGVDFYIDGQCPS